MSDIAVLVIFGGGALFVFAALYAFHLRGMYLLRKTEGGGDRTAWSFSITFARLYALIAVAVIGGLLAFSDASSNIVPAAFTLLGTVAGYLAGARPSPPGQGQEEQVI